MIILDTNMILRYLLNDNKEMADEKDVLKVALETYGKQNLDFVDCILYAYNRVKGV